MRCGQTLGGLTVALAMLVTPALHATEAPANPEAVALYNEGMRQLERVMPQTVPLAGNEAVYAEAEALFRKAVAFDLPHAYFGLACTIFTSVNVERFDEGWQLALYAAHRGVIEAEAFIANRMYQRIVSPASFSDPRLADLMLKDLYRRADQPGFISGAPGTVVLNSPADARRLIDKAFGPGSCRSDLEKHVSWGLRTPLQETIEKIRARIHWKKLPPANPEAVAAYRRGMDLLGRPPGYVDLTQVETLFKRAVELGLPHAHYGMACLIQARRDDARFREALRELKWAADHQVLEAKALMVWFARIQKDVMDLDSMGSLWDEVASLALDPNLVSGAPGTVTFSSPEDATRVVWDIAGTGYCAGGLYPRVIQYPDMSPEKPADDASKN